MAARFTRFLRKHVKIPSMHQPRGDDTCSLGRGESVVVKTTNSSYFHKILNLIFNVIFFLYAGYKMWNWWSYFRIPFPLHVIALHFNITIVKVESLIFKEELWLGDDTNIPLISLKISYNHCILKCRRHPIRFCILIFQKSDIETFNFECLESISDVYSQSLNILLILIK